jgi:hypothetical protein
MSTGPERLLIENVAEDFGGGKAMGLPAVASVQ